MKKYFVLLLSLIFLASNFSLSAQDIDESFANQGFFLYNHSNKSSSWGQSVMAQSDGKVIVTGSTSVGDLSMLCVVRCNADGTLDPAFNTTGIKNIYTGRLATVNSRIYSEVALQADGKLLVVCIYSDHDVNSTLVIRLNPDGSDDLSFAANGYLHIPDTYCKNLIVQPDGKIIIGGISTGTLFLRRLNVDGSTDNQFGLGGEIRTTITSDADLMEDMALQSDGKIVITGSAHSVSTGTDDLFVARLNPDGSFDVSFDADGKFIYTPNTTNEMPLNVALQSNSNIVVAANIAGKGTVLNFKPDGTFDTSFDSDGILNLPSHYNSIVCMSVQQDDQIIISVGDYNFNQDITLLRISTTGLFDTAFNGTGTVFGYQSTSYDFSAVFDQGTALYVSDAGNIYTTGISNGSLAVSVTRSDGSMDASFNTIGRNTYYPGTSYNTFLCSASQPDGKILAGGHWNQINPLLVRVNADGTRDQHFGTSGVLAEQLVDGMDYITCLAVQNDHQILVAGEHTVFTPSPESRLGIIRLKEDGTFDPAFGTNGKASLQIAEAIYYTPWEMLIQPDGKILVGASGSDFTYNSYISRLMPDGTKDVTFNGTGDVTLSYDACRMAIQADGKILVLGYAYGSFNITRLLADGTKDVSFGDLGEKILNISSGYNYNPKSIKIQDGKIVLTLMLSGQLTINNGIAVVRLNADGSFDTSFNTTGYLLFAQNSGSDGQDPKSFLIQSDHKIIVAATTQTIDSYAYHGLLLKLNEDGTYDTDFNGSGSKLYEQPDNSLMFNASLWNEEGSIIVAGNLNGNALLAKIENDRPISTANMEAKEEQQMVVFPNPTIDGAFSIQSDYSINQVNLTDALGRKESHQSGFIKTKLKGILIAEVETEQGVYKIKLVSE